MTIPARYSLTEAHFRIAELERSVELAWAAGLWCGEGCVSHKSNSRGLPFPQPQMNMTDEESVRRFAAAVGVGQVNGPYHYAARRSLNKPYWRWQCGYQAGRTVYALLSPYLSAEKSNQFRRIYKEAGRELPEPA